MNKFLQLISLFLVLFLSHTDIHGYSVFGIPFTKEELILKKMLFKIDHNEYLITPLLYKNLDKIVAVDVEILKNFDKYLKKKRRSKLSIELLNIEMLWSDLYEASKDLNQAIGTNCTRKNIVFSNNRSLFNLLSQSFSIDFIKSNISSIADIVTYYQIKSSYNCMLSMRKDLVYVDSKYRIYCEVFLSDFLEFLYREKRVLNSNSVKFEELRKIVVLYKGLIGKQTVTLYYPDFMLLLHYQNRIKQFPEELLFFFSELDSFKKPFSLDLENELLSKLKDQ